MTLDDLTTPAIADALRDAFANDLIDCKPIRAWADRQIEAVSVAPTWMIDLAFCSDDDAEYYLRNVPGECGERDGEPLLLGLLYYAVSEQRISSGDLRSLGFDLYLREAAAGAEHWGLNLDLAIETVINGYGSDSNIEQAVDYARKQLLDYVRFVPDWLRNG